MNKDRVLSVSLLLFIILFFYESGNIPEKAASQTFGSAFYPRILLTILSLLTVVLLIKSFVVKNKKIPDGKTTSFKAYGYVIVLFVVTGFYIYLINIIGFLFSTCLYLIVSQILLIGFKKIRYLTMSVSASIIIAFSVHFIFENYLNILLP